MRNIKILISLILCAIILASCGAPQTAEISANEATEEVYQYLCDSFGKVMLSCQQESTWMGSPDYEMDIIEQATGKLPAMRGLDFMNGDFDGVVERAKEWWEKGGLVTICWHTGINGKGYQESKDDIPDFEKLLDESTPEHAAMIDNWDKAANALSELRDAGVPVLWRPFHEFDGGWFWWGASGAEPYKELYIHLYDRLTNYHKLNNIIWVWNGDSAEWYPGDEYVDIVSTDIYADKHEYSSQINKFIAVGEASGGKKPVALAENGVQIDPDLMERDNVYWLYFCTWGGEYCTTDIYTSDEMFKKVFNSDQVLTLDELPDWRKY